MTSFRAAEVARPWDARGGAADGSSDADGCGFCAGADPDLTAESDLDRYLSRLFLPLKREGETFLIALADTSTENLAWLRAA